MSQVEFQEIFLRTIFFTNTALGLLDRSPGECHFVHTHTFAYKPVCVLFWESKGYSRKKLLAMFENAMTEMTGFLDQALIMTRRSRMPVTIKLHKCR